MSTCPIHGWHEGSDCPACYSDYCNTIQNGTIPPGFTSSTYTERAHKDLVIIKMKEDKREISHAEAEKRREKVREEADRHYQEILKRRAENILAKQKHAEMERERQLREYQDFRRSLAMNPPGNGLSVAERAIVEKQYREAIRNHLGIILPEP